MQQGQRRPQRTAPEPRNNAVTGGRADGMDVNRERLVYCITSLVGHKVTAKLRNNVVYEGLFHSCQVDGDYSITLKCARRCPVEDAGRNVEVVNTLIIPGKDYLQVSATNLPPPSAMLAGDEASSPLALGNKSFQVDSEISSRKGGDVTTTAGRELVPWADGHSAAGGGLDDAQQDPNWDQFKVNERLYGVSTTFDEEMYTTKLNRDAIPKEQREMADRIAREIESGQMASEKEGTLEGEENDEETRFSAVRSNVAISNAPQMRKEQQRAEAVSQGPLPQMPQARDLGQHDAVSNLPNEGFTRDNRKKSGMISEMKRINALNLEPTLPKPDDGTRNSRINYTEPQARNARLAQQQQSGDLKMEFQQSLAVIQRQEESKHEKRKAAGNAEANRPGAPPPSYGTGGGQLDQQSSQQGNMMMYHRKSDPGQQQQVAGAAGYPQGGDRGKQNFTFNPAAKAFSLNPAAGEFTPGGSAAATGNSGRPPSNTKQPTSTLQFTFSNKNPDLARKALATILEPFFQTAKHVHTLTPDWPDAKGGISYHDILGQPSGRPTLGVVPGGGGGGGAEPVPGNSWQQGPPVHDQVPNGMANMGPGSGPAPQMMQPGFVLSNTPQGGPPSQMYAQMYAAPGGGGPGPQGHQSGMPQQAPVMFGQQAMMAQQAQSMAMPGGMGPVPKFGNQQGQQMVVMPVILGPGGQYQPQGFVPQQGVQQPGQQGPPGQPGPPGSQAEGQGPMMQQPMYHRQGGGG